MKKTVMIIEMIPVCLLFVSLLALEGVYVGCITFAACIIHEAGHYLTIKALGYDGSFITLTGGAKIKTQNIMSYKEELAVVLSGPLVNMTAVVVLALLPYGWAYDASGINAAVAVMNLIPIRTLDGSRAVSLILSSVIPYGAAEKICGVLSLICCFFAVFLSLYLLFRTGEDIYLVFFAFLLSSRHVHGQFAKNIQ